MGGGLATAALAAAVSRTGALGTVGMMAEPSAMASQLREAKQRAPGRPIAANLLVPFARRGHVQACIAEKVDAVVLFAGFSGRVVEPLKDAGILVLHQVGTVPQAKRALSDGADGLIAQGVEAGGHVVGDAPALEVLQDLRGIAQQKPVLLAGGVCDSTRTLAALEAGAAAVVSGSRFLLTDECPAHPAYKARVTNAQSTVITELFGLGWPLKHHVVPNAATEKWGDPAALRAFNRLTAPLLQRLPASAATRLAPLQHKAIPLYSPAAFLEGMDARLIELMPLYAGDCVREIESVVPAQEAVRLLTTPTPS
jgi:NAD(P)H-dependent flavin oxidoreductase YrpB (nitropropane dioxygenase family)